MAQSCTGCGSPDHNLRTCTMPGARAISREKERARDRAAKKKKWRTSSSFRKKHYELKAASHARGLITYAELRAEGVLEIARPDGTSCVFVRTKKGLRIFHAKALPDRQLDAHAIQLAIGWLSQGISHEVVADNLDVAPKHLANELKRHGYERMSLQVSGPRKGADERLTAEKHKRGNRRGSRVELAGGKMHFTRTVSP